MRRLIIFLVGLLLLLLTFVTLYFSGALFDAADKRQIEPFVAQPNNLSEERIGRPITIEQATDTFVRERLIRKFVYEYFYVNPDVENIARRTRGDSVLATLSSKDVFNQWRAGTAEEIENLASKKYMRTVNIAREIILPKDSNYWVVNYDLYTWDAPNDMGLLPMVTSGTMYLKIEFIKGIRGQSGSSEFNVKQHLENGGDPAAIFMFRVDEVM